ncbi:MAG: serine/threonine protein phosphatase [Pirellulaceae bacterium]|nr:serine/threonine protein phosphatase [Pirellulaceae bacterium]
MKQYAIGDVHGCLNALQTLMELVGPSSDDLLVMLGDYVDRGPDSRGVLQWLIDRSSRANMVCLRGNHEIMMLDARRDLHYRRRWCQAGGGETWDSYEDATDDFESFAAIPDQHWQFLENLLPYYETETHVFIHAAAYGDVPMEEQPEYMLFWERFGMITPREDGKTFVCGHTRQHSGLPKQVEHAICIDTSACRGGWLTCLDVQAGKYYQANEDQETRSGWMDELESDL